MNEPEEWRVIPGWDGRYEASSAGQIRSWVNRRYSGPLPRLLSQARQSQGYLMVSLSIGGRTTKHLVHRLVLAAFVGPCPPGNETRHLDGRRGNNRLANLAYGTPGDNGQDRVRHGTTWNPQAHQTHCKRGHPFDEANTLMWRGQRRCRACGRLRQAAFRQAHPSTPRPRKPAPRGVNPNAHKTHCPKGHPYDEANTYWRKRSSGGRACRACKRDWQREHAGAAPTGMGGHQRAKTHCPQGHEYTPENTYTYPKGGRSCRACRRDNLRRWKEAKRAHTQASTKDAA